MFKWLKRKPVVTYEGHFTALDMKIFLAQDEITKQISELRNSVEALRNSIDAVRKVYTCIICGEEFTRLPQQSNKRCPACQREIKTVGASTSNNGHRPSGHNTRGIHKGPKE